MPKLRIISTNNLDRTIIVTINGVRYEYWFHGEVPLSTVNKILRYSNGRAIDYLNSRSYKVDRITPYEKEKATVTTKS